MSEQETVVEQEVNWRQAAENISMELHEARRRLADYRHLVACMLLSVGHSVTVTVEQMDKADASKVVIASTFAGETTLSLKD